ncbi:MAG: hypothetical protein QNJ47_18255 [Nostocaceae cyanobacterium]|nr:hypothetical protein [Nostocaceae cyanobacterium]
MKELIYFFAQDPTSKSVTTEISLVKDLFIPIVTIILTIISTIFGGAFIWIFVRYETLRKEAISNLKTRYFNEINFLKMQLDKKDKEASKNVSEMAEMRDILQKLQPILDENSGASVDLKRRVKNILQDILTAEQKAEQSIENTKKALDWLKLKKNKIVSYAKEEILSQDADYLKGKEKDIDREILIFIECLTTSLQAVEYIPLKKSVSLSIDNPLIYEKILKQIIFYCDQQTELGDLPEEANRFFKYFIKEMIEDTKSRINTQ